MRFRWKWITFSSQETTFSHSATTMPSSRIPSRECLWWFMRSMRRHLYAYCASVSSREDSHFLAMFVLMNMQIGLIKFHLVFVLFFCAKPRQGVKCHQLVLGWLTHSLRHRVKALVASKLLAINHRNCDISLGAMRMYCLQRGGPSVCRRSHGGQYNFNCI